MTAQENMKRLADLKLLPALLADRTTGGCIHWATNAYSRLGLGYKAADEITEEALLEPAFELKSRVEKTGIDRALRTKNRAEVFTPTDVVRLMNDKADETWFGYPGAFDGCRVLFAAGSGWKDYVSSTRLEITCGEGPYLAMRYDAATGESIPLPRRAGILDRKLRVVTENADGESEWAEWALNACMAVYGYEYQGDSLLLARMNVLTDVEEHFMAVLGRMPTEEEYSRLTDVISWNLWQMNGLTGETPVPAAVRTEGQSTAAAGSVPGRRPASSGDSFSRQPPKTYMPCWIFDWKTGTSLPYRSLAQSA